MEVIDFILWFRWFRPESLSGKQTHTIQPEYRTNRSEDSLMQCKRLRNPS